MQRKTKKIVLALVVIGVVAAGGAAFTAANTVPSARGRATARPSSPAPSPADIDHTLSADGMTIDKHGR